MYYFIVSWAQCWTPPQGLSQAVIKVLVRAIVISRFNWRRIRFQAHLCGRCQDSVSCRILNWGPQFLAGCWLEAILNTLSHGPLQHGSRLSQSKQDSKIEVTVFYNLHLRNDIPSFCFILFCFCCFCESLLVLLSFLYINLKNLNCGKIHKTWNLSS